MPKNSKVRNELIKEVRLLLGDGMVDIELDPDHYDLAVDVALSKIQQRSENAVEEDFYSIELKKDVDEYTLCLLYTSPSPRDATLSRMPSSA